MYSRSSGVYIPASDLQDELLSPDSLWDSSNPEKAIALMATRELFLEKGKGLIREDFARISGLQM